MNSVLVFLLVLAIFFSRRSYITATEGTNDSCYIKCPPGFYKKGPCTKNETKVECKKCDDGFYTAVENRYRKCLRCGTCSNYEEQIRACTIENNTVCDCQKGYYNANPRSSEKDCKPCTIKSTTNSDYKKKCEACNSSECLKDPECQRNCSKTTTTTTTTTTPTTVSTTVIIKTSVVTTRSNKPPPPGNYTYTFVCLVVLFAVVFGLLLLKNLYDNPDCCSYWIPKKDVKKPTEAPKFNEQHSHQGSASATLTLNIGEETPMMTLCQSPSTPEHPACISTLLPNTEHKAARQDEQSKDWPAIVLYAIIKEVPLRRWKEFLRLLSVADEELERAELDAGLGLGSMERQYQMLRMWSQRPSASLNDVLSALHYMELSRCAQLLQENLENLQWRPESKQDFNA
ncbi:tumor necrosis factor receptor superfamily member 1A [Anabas testudineus]|uniref:Si:ch211-112c15.8 n=1 Tax=Anabas testudineus TaxID=64144 RepID=A0AAQ6IJ26_ANATE|nr:tumor necrosis factor receptor superfamily member 1A [Anabas testudineus]